MPFIKTKAVEVVLVEVVTATSVAVGPAALDIGVCHEAVVAVNAVTTWPAVGAAAAEITTSAPAPPAVANWVARTVFVVPVSVLLVSVCASVVPTMLPVAPCTPDVAAT